MWLAARRRLQCTCVAASTSEPQVCMCVCCRFAYWRKAPNKQVTTACRIHYLAAFEYRDEKDMLSSGGVSRSSWSAMFAGRGAGTRTHSGHIGVKVERISACGRALLIHCPSLECLAGRHDRYEWSAIRAGSVVKQCRGREVGGCMTQGLRTLYPSTARPTYDLRCVTQKSANEKQTECAHELLWRSHT